MKNCLTTKIFVFVVVVKKLKQLRKRNTFNAFPPVVKFSWLETDFSISTGVFGCRSSNKLEMNEELHDLGHSQNSDSSALPYYLLPFLNVRVCVGYVIVDKYFSGLKFV